MTKKIATKRLGLPSIVTKNIASKRLGPSIVTKQISTKRLGRRIAISIILIEYKEDIIASYCIATAEQEGTVTEYLTQFDNEQMQQLVICHRLISSNYSLNLDIVDPNKEDGEMVEQTYRCSNPHNVERHSISPEEAEAPDGRYDPPSYVVSMIGYLIY